MPVNLLIEDEAWPALVGEDGKNILNRLCNLVFARAPVLAELPEDLRGELQLSVVLTVDEAVRKLNREFRGQDKPTNVLSFPAYESVDALHAALTAPLGFPGEDAAYLGDTIFARETITREAAEQNKPPEDHFRHLVVHGVLHLLGYDHGETEEAEAMEALEIAILGELSIANPYR